MNRIVLLAAAIALGGTATQSMSATVLGTDVTQGSYMSADVHYRFGSEPQNVGSYSGTYWSIVGFGNVFQVCAELHDDDNIASSYQVSTGISAYGDVRNAQLVTLFSNAYPMLNSAVASYVATNGVLSYNPALESEWTAIAEYSVALQTLTWVIVENNSPTISPTDPSTPFGIVDDNQGNLVATNYIIDWAANINNGTWIPGDGVTLYHAASAQSTTQDRIWAQVSVPEPTALTMVAGLALIGIMRRRRV